MIIQTMLEFRSIVFIIPIIQLICICVLFIATTLVQFRIHKKSGKLFSYYPLNSFLLFAPIYEEIIFRGIILGGLLSSYSPILALIISSLLFGLWHLKNIFILPKKLLVFQMIYTGLILGPITAYITLQTGTIWIGVIIHFLNNLIAPVIDNGYTQQFLKIKSQIQPSIEYIND